MPAQPPTPPSEDASGPAWLNALPCPAERSAIRRVLPPWQGDERLLGVAGSRIVESLAQSTLAPHALMRRAGLAVARLALAVAPHARRVWIACGPGNNGGDGLLAALHLHRAGKAVHVTWTGTPDRLPDDARDAWSQIRSAGLPLHDATAAVPALTADDLAIDALLGLGARRTPTGPLADLVERINALPCPVLAVDLPSGLDADTGWLDAPEDQRRCVRATHTLSLLTLKPGLFTAHGRDQAGAIWFCDLGVDADAVLASPLARASSGTERAADGAPPFNATRLVGHVQAFAPLSPRRHAQHKGSFGSVAVIGGAPGMTGAALLAARTALHQGAGRVYVQLLEPESSGVMRIDPQQPELMLRATLDWDAAESREFTAVCGCGGGEAVATVLPDVLRHASRLVLDADALNAIARDAGLLTALRERRTRSQPTVLTPHPLEAARLLHTGTAQVQADRCMAARGLSLDTGAVVVLKGSGTVIAAPDGRVWISPSGNARLGTAGTGDVLAGCIGALWAQGLEAAEAAVAGVYRHGWWADCWPTGEALVAGDLAAASSHPASEPPR